MTQTTPPGALSRAQFLRTAGKGGLAGARRRRARVRRGRGVRCHQRRHLHAAGGVHRRGSPVYLYTAILKNFNSFKHPKLQNRDYFVAALGDEQDHKAFLANALGGKTPVSPPRRFLCARQVPDRLFKLRTEKPPGPAKLPSREESTPRVFLDGVRLQIEQRCDVRHREHVLARDASLEHLRSRWLPESFGFAAGARPVSRDLRLRTTAASVPDR